MAEPTMQDAIDAGNGTLHGAIDHWQTQALLHKERAEKEFSLRLTADAELINARAELQSSRQQADLWKAMAEYWHAKHVYPDRMELSFGALNAMMDRWEREGLSPSEDIRAMAFASVNKDFAAKEPT